MGKEIALAFASALGILLAAAPRAVAQDSAAARLPAAVVCTLANGDRISGALVRSTRASIRLRNSALGDIRLPRRRVAVCESPSDSARQRIGALALAPFDAGDVVLTTEAFAPNRPEVVVVAMAPVSLDRLERPKVATPLGARALPAYAAAVGWKRNIGTTYALSRGNANTSDLGFTGGIIRRAPRSQIALHARRRFASNEGRQAADFFSATLRYDLALGPNDSAAARRPSFFSETVYEHDPFAKVVRRGVSNIGLSVPLSPDPKNNLALEIGGGITHETPEGSESPYTHFGGLLRLAAKQVFGGTHADQQFAAFPDLTGPVGHYRFNTDLNVAAPLAERVALKLGLLNRYDTHPQTRVRKDDTTIQSGIGVEF